MFKLNSIQMLALGLTAGSTFGADSLTVALDSLVQSVQNLQESFPVPPGPGQVLEMTWLHEETPPPIVEDNAPKPKKVQTPQKVEQAAKMHEALIGAFEVPKLRTKTLQNPFIQELLNTGQLPEFHIFFDKVERMSQKIISQVERTLASQYSPSSS